MTRSEAAKARWANDEFKEKVKASMKGKHTRKRGPMTEEQKKKLQTSNPEKRTVYQFTLEGEFIAEYPSQKEASKQTGIPQSTIGRFLNRGERDTIHRGTGYIWSYERDCKTVTPQRKVRQLINDHPTQEVLDKIHSTSLPNGPAEVTQYDYKGNVIARYATLGEAGRMNGFDAAAISNCCRRKRDTAYGYIWAYTK